MNYKLLALDVSAILVSFLVLMLPITSASSFSGYISGNKINFENEKVRNNQEIKIQKNNDNIFTGFASAVSSIMAGFIDVLQTVLSEFVKSIIPGVKAQGSCNANLTCDLPDESSSTCCYDCGCPQPQSQYCDWSTDKTQGFCYDKDFSLQTEVSPTSFTNCYVSHEANLTLKITGSHPPSQMNIDSNSKYYLNDGEHIGSLNGCVLSNEWPGYKEYECTINIPVLSSCILTQNSLELEITYKDGPYNKVFTFPSVGLSDITISSFNCGDDVCDTDLNEDYNTCCYDCPCPSGDYCDISDYEKANDKSAGSCESDLSSYDLLINADDIQLQTHDSSGDTAIFYVELRKKPKSLQFSSPSCVMDCSTTGECDASCSVSCREEQSSNPSIEYNASCTLTYRITSGYDISEQYTLTPEINFSLRYNNGSGYIQKTFTKSNYETFTITISGSRCGDGEIGPDETRSNCCIDVPCDEGYYCEWIDDQGECKRLGDIYILFDSMEPESFESYVDEETYQILPGITGKALFTKPKEVEVKFNVYGIPQNLRRYDSSCSFGIDDVPCRVMGCVGESTGPDSMLLTCDISIPKIRYKELPSGYFDSSDNEINLNTNTFDVFLTFKNGTADITRKLTASIPTITIKLVPECGNGICETELGEDYNTCCWDWEGGSDCACPGQMVCGGFPTNNRCFDPSDIGLMIDFPDENCIISSISGNCTFIRAIEFNVKIVNPQENMTTYDYKYFYEDMMHGMNCRPTEGSVEDYTCSIEKLQSIDNQNEGREQREITILFYIKYPVEGQMISHAINGTARFEVARERSPDLMTCLEKKHKFDKDIERAEKKRDLFKKLKWVYLAIAGALWTTCLVCKIFFADCGGVGTWACRIAPWYSLGACVIQLLPEKWFVPTLEQVEGIKDEFDELCGGTGVKYYEFTTETLEDRLNNLKGELHKGVMYMNLKDWTDKITGQDFLMIATCIIGLATTPIGSWLVPGFIKKVFTFGEGKGETQNQNSGFIDDTSEIEQMLGQESDTENV